MGKSFNRDCQRRLIQSPPATFLTMSTSSDAGAGSSNFQTTILRNPVQAVNPSASLTSLWAYLEPALQHMLSSPTHIPGKAPTVDVAYHVGIHTAVYNYFTSLSDSPTSLVPAFGNGKGKDIGASGTDLYERLDRFFTDTAQEIFLGIPADDSTLLEYYVPSFHRYSAGIQSINRVLN